MLKVKKNINEPAISLLRRFKNKIRQANILTEAKSRQFKKRKVSKNVGKKQTLKRIEKRKRTANLRRWGKI